MSSFDDATWSRLEDRWARGFESLVPEEQEALALYWLEAETMNGALHQFFKNSSGDLALLALSGLKRLNMPLTLAALERAMACFETPYPLDQDERMAQLKRLDERFGDSLFDAETALIEDMTERFLDAAVASLKAMYDSPSWSPSA